MNGYCFIGNLSLFRFTVILNKNIDGKFILRYAIAVTIMFRWIFANVTNLLFAQNNITRRGMNRR